MPPSTCTADRALRDAPPRRRAAWPRDRPGGSLTGRIRRTGRGRRVGRAPGEPGADVHVGEQVLDRLERADRDAELLPLERVRNGPRPARLRRRRPACRRSGPCRAAAAGPRRAASPTDVPVRQGGEASPTGVSGSSGAPSSGVGAPSLGATVTRSACSATTRSASSACARTTGPAICPTRARSSGRRRSRPPATRRRTSTTARDRRPGAGRAARTRAPRRPARARCRPRFGDQDPEDAELRQRGPGAGGGRLALPPGDAVRRVLAAEGDDGFAQRELLVVKPKSIASVAALTLKYLDI